ncbi:MAG: Type 1 glutamine amidotransferase-like domain-containing protein [Lachnospiraceae bacterium]|mgnify:CR=1 FL=1|nr:Type 1 glutamine amidotransferase-like domain-containing protein [Lachnospiraceae bacterium]MEE1255101.1 Type 1 glutamine amidotransferase-like domain-containing protein [Lachnospiraceae bacterium]
MRVFLTSSPAGNYFTSDGKRAACKLDESNAFVEELKKCWKENARCLMISAAPDEYEMNDSIRDIFLQAFPMSGLSVSEMMVWDHRNNEQEEDYLAQFDMLLLSGGHVPTQNAFFKEIELRDRIADYDGIVIGISAGTMNCADLVYAMPELEGEALDKIYRRFVLGLGLTDIMVIPHYQYLKGAMLDGMNIIEDIAFADSMGRSFYALPDGSYIEITDDKTMLFGEAYLIRDGKLTKICENDESLDISREEDLEKLILLKRCKDV